jgi:ABC-type amino acid transport substrate-binding protein
MRNWLLGAVIAGGALLSAQAYAQDVVRIGTEADYPPFEYTAASGQLKGMEIELGNQYCAVAKLQCKWVNMSFDAMIAALNAHKIDAVLSQMGITDAREKSVSFTAPVTFNGVVVVGPKGSAITEDPVTMKGKTIGVQSGTIEEAWANKNLKGVATVKSYDGQDQAFQDLQAQRIDATICDQPVAYDFLRKGGKAEFDYLGKPLVDPTTLGSGNTAMAVRKDDTKLRDTLDGAINQVLKDGSFAKVNAEYFPFSMAPKS